MTTQQALPIPLGSPGTSPMSTPARGVFEARLHFTGRALYLAVAVFVVFLGVGPGHASAQSSAAIESIAMDLKTDREFSERWPGAGIRIGAQAYLEAFYVDLGFVTDSAVYVEDGIPHIKMVFKDIP